MGLILAATLSQVPAFAQAVLQAPTQEGAQTTQPPPAPPASVTPGPAVDLPTTVPAPMSGEAAPAPEAAGAPIALPPSGIERSQQLPHDLSPWGMFMAADIVVKAVMIGLAIASFAVWTVWLAKLMELMTARIGLRRGLRALAEEPSLDSAAMHLTRRTVVAKGMVRVARAEIELSEDVLNGAGLKERVASRLSGLDATLTRRMRRGMSFLATVGATSPFVGLFGTVWGIMNSFIGISKSQTTSLAVVAPGIAEALLATGIGLVAAIPAVILYNQLSRSIAGYRALVRETSDEVERLVSRDIDRRAANRPPVALARRGQA
jgi:biopolymer transport protein ExbB